MKASCEISVKARAFSIIGAGESFSKYRQAGRGDGQQQRDVLWLGCQVIRHIVIVLNLLDIGQGCRPCAL